MMENGKTVKGMEEEFYSLTMVQFIKEYGKTIKQLIMEG